MTNQERYLVTVQNYNAFITLIEDRVWNMFDTIGETFKVLQHLPENTIPIIGTFSMANFYDLQRKCSSGLWIEELYPDKIYLKTNDGEYANNSFILPLDFACATDEEFNLALVTLKKDLTEAYEKIKDDEKRLEQEKKDLINSEDYKEYLRLKSKFEK